MTMTMTLSVLLFALLFASFTFADEEIVEVQQGKLRGNVERNYRSFLGVPFAAPPVGELRWKPPREPSNFVFTYDATKLKDDCAQPRRTTGVSEDCLYLNIFTPRVSNSGYGDWPVLFFIHGGSFESGRVGSSDLFFGDEFVQYAKSYILVLTNYRLGAFGFLGSDELASESEDGSTGNFGLQDQRQAMMWVKNNIAAFGGNPNKILIFGESAGSWSVQYHLTLAKSRGLFQAAIMQSGTSNGMFVANSTEYNQQWGIYAKEVGCNRKDLNCMRRAGWRRFVNLNKADQWGLRIDGVEISEDPRELIKSGRFYRIPVIIGSNLNELIPLPDIRDVRNEEYEDFLVKTYGPKYGDNYARNLKNVYSVGESGRYSTVWYAKQAIDTHEFFTCSSRRNAQWMSRYTTVYHYELRQTLQSLVNNNPDIGAYHGVDLYFSLRRTYRFTSPLDYTLSEIFVNYWTTMSSVLNPNNNSTNIFWPAYDEFSRQTISLTSNPAIVKDIYEEECNTWDTVQDIPPQLSSLTPLF